VALVGRIRTRSERSARRVLVLLATAWLARAAVPCAMAFDLAAHAAAAEEVAAEGSGQAASGEFCRCCPEGASGCGLMGCADLSPAGLDQPAAQWTPPAPLALPLRFEPLAPLAAPSRPRLAPLLGAAGAAQPPVLHLIHCIQLR
jgi:hypothetical protein